MLQKPACQLLAQMFCALFVGVAPAMAADKGRISALSDVSFGTITDLENDSVIAQSVCVYAKSALNNYRVTATGSGSGGAFDLNSASDTLGYELQWNDTADQTGGTELSPNVPLTAQHSTATRDDCSKGPTATASLVVILRSVAVSSATAGSYTGSLTLVIAPE